MLESGQLSLLLEAVTSDLNKLAECYEILAKEHGEKYAELKVKYLIALQTPKQEGDAKVPEENSEAKGRIATINAREVEEQAMDLITLKTPEQEWDAKVPEENSEDKGRTAIINAREVEEQATDLITLKTPEQEGDAKVPEENSQAKGMTTIINAR